jgi:hypothetical protein
VERRKLADYLKYELPEWVFWAALIALTLVVVLLNVLCSKWVGIGACILYIAILTPVAVYGLRQR